MFFFIFMFCFNRRFLKLLEILNFYLPNAPNRLTFPPEKILKLRIEVLFYYLLYTHTKKNNIKKKHLHPYKINTFNDRK